MSFELAVGALFLLAGLWFASTALFPSGPQVRVLFGAGGALSRGVRGILVDPPAPAMAPAPPDAWAAPVRRAGAPPADGPGVPLDIGSTQDPSLAVTLHQTLTALERVLDQLSSVLAAADEGAGPRLGERTSSRRGLTVSQLLGESAPGGRPRHDAAPASPFLNRLFELCEEAGEVDETTPVPSAYGPASRRAEGEQHSIARDDPHEGTPMSNPTDPSESDVGYQRGDIPADVAAEMFEVAMAALSQALIDEERAVREASLRALGAIDREAVRRWAAVKLLTGGGDDMAAGARIVSAIGLHEVVGEVLERALEARAPQRDRAVGALRALAPTPELLERTMEQIGEGQRARLPGLLPELFEGPRLTGMLQVLVRDRSEQVRMAALDVLAGHADRDTVLRVASNVIAVDQSPAVRVVAADLLGRAGTSSPRSGSDALTDTAVQEAAAPPALPEDPVALWQLLLERVGRGDEEVIAEAAEQRRDPLMAAVLSHADDADAAARALAVRAALRAGTEDGVVIATLALADPDPQVRRAAVAVCHRTDAGDTSTALRRLVTDPDLEVRKAAVEALVRSDDDAATSSLVSALADPDDDIRAVARNALGTRPSPEVARLLVDELEVEGGRRAAAEILRDMGETGRHAVEQAIPTLSGDALVAAGPVLAGGTGAVERYLRDLVSLDPAARQRAVRALGAIGGQPGVSALVGRLQDPVEGIRMEALEHLGRLAGADIVPLLRRIRAGDPVPAVAAAAERALGRVLDRTGTR